MSRSSKKFFRRISKNKYENKYHQSSNSHMNPKIWLKYFKKDLSTEKSTFANGW